MIDNDDLRLVQLCRDDGLYRLAFGSPGNEVAYYVRFFNDGTLLLQSYCGHRMVLEPVRNSEGGVCQDAVLLRSLSPAPESADHSHSEVLGGGEAA